MKYIYAKKPTYNPETHNLYPSYHLENGVFHAGWMTSLLLAGMSGFGELRAKAG